MPTLPSSIALTSIGTGAQILSADHRNNYSSVQTAVNALITALAGGVNGQLLQASDATTVAWTTMSTVRASNSAAQSLTSGVETTLAFNTESYDTDNIHDLVTSNSRLTCKTAGKYRIWACIEFAANATGYRSVLLKRNGTSYIGGLQVPAVATVSVTTILPVSVEKDMLVNDYVECNAVQNSGGALNVTVNSDLSPMFGMTRIEA